MAVAIGSRSMAQEIPAWCEFAVSVPAGVHSVLFSATETSLNMSVT